MKFALRSLLKAPSFTVVALLTLALGIGVNTSMFSLIDALLFNAGPFPRPGEIHQISAETRQGEGRAFSEVELREIRAKTSSFSTVTSMRYFPAAISEPGRPAEQVYCALASVEFFDTFGMQPMFGRAWTAAETQPGNNQVAVLSHAFWQRRFGGDRSVIGRTLRIDSEAVTIIGVMPPSFDYRLMWGTIAFWRPLNFTPEQIKGRTYRVFGLWGRLKPGVSTRQAAAELEPVAVAQQKDFPQDYTGLRYRVTVMREALMDNDSRTILWMLLGLSGFVLLIACANLANLQLARATAAAKEFAIRAALGASRGRLIWQQLMECMLLSVTGGALGILLALWVNNALSASIRISDEIGGLALPINGTVLAVTMLASLATGVLFGIVPAWFASRTDVVTALKSQSRGSTVGRGHHRMRQLLIIGEVALALVLLGGAGVMQRGFSKFLQKSVGWDTSKVLSAILPMPEKRFPTPTDRIEFFRKVETRLAALPGVESVALATSLPLWDYGSTRQIMTDKQASGDKTNLPRASHVMVTTDFFKTLGLQVLEGHTFAPDIKPDDPKIIVINEALARQLWPGESAVGRRLASVDGENVTWSEVVGVVRSAESAASMSNPETPYQVYKPIVHEPWSWVRVAIRSQNPGALVDSVRRAIAEVDPDLPADALQTVAQFVDRAQHNLVIVAGLLLGFAGVGLLLAAVGLYGVISNLVAQRTGEFGIRLALGARPTDVLTLVLNHGVRLSAIGLVIGLARAYGLSRLLGSVMPRIVAPDPIALGGVAVILFGVALLACWFPARRATKVDPMIALRAE
ncbi:MAG TPA: ABC transporter permease [Candidatus Didemnitutus sp.]|nr:ABC transporter permease [Candidatus Didemnitutus sp.]